MKVDYWFSLCSDIFIWKKGCRCLFYDSRTGKKQIFLLDAPELIQFIAWLLDFDHLYCIAFTDANLQTHTLRKIIDKLVSLKMAKLSKNENTRKRPPIQLPPLLNLQTDINRITVEGATDLTIGEYVLRNLHEITLQLPQKSNNDYIEGISNILHSLSGSSVNKITVIGWQEKMADYDWLTSLLFSCNIPVCFVLPIENVLLFLPEIEALQIPNASIRIIVTSYSDETMKSIINIGSISIPVSWEYHVTSKIECKKADDLINLIGNDKTSVLPQYNGVNLAFFEKNVYLSKKDIQQCHLSKREVFAHQVLNTTDFGKLTVTAEGKVYANILHSPIGTIKDDLRFLVYKEMKDGVSWRRIRDMKPCCDCLYQYLCPSPSNYELAIGKANLCHIITLPSY